MTQNSEVAVATEEGGNGWKIVGAVLLAMSASAIFADWAAAKPLYTTHVDFIQFVIGHAANAIKTIMR
jgi:hypothetical protein